MFFYYIVKLFLGIQIGKGIERTNNNNYYHHKYRINNLELKVKDYERLFKKKSINTLSLLQNLE